MCEAGGSTRHAHAPSCTLKTFPSKPPHTQLLLRWTAERGTPALWSASTPAHASANAAAATGWALPPPVRIALDAAETGTRFHRPDADWPAAEDGGALKPSPVVL